MKLMNISFLVMSILLPTYSVSTMATKLVLDKGAAAADVSPSEKLCQLITNNNIHQITMLKGEKWEAACNSLCTCNDPDMPKLKEKLFLHTPLMHAAAKGNLPVVRHLFEQAKADINKTNTYGWTALYFAAWKGHLPVVQYLVEQAKADIDKTTQGGATALHFAAYQGHLPVVQCLVEQAKADINKTNNNGGTALHFAAYHGHLAVVRYLVQAKANINKTNLKGLTALHFAAERGHLPIVQYLVQAKDDINKTNNNGYTALHIAALKGHLPVVQYLVQAKDDINKTANNGWTALHIAAYKGHLDIVQYFIEQASCIINKRLQTENKESVIQIVDQNNHPEIAELLREVVRSRLTDEDLCCICLTSFEKEEKKQTAYVFDCCLNAICHGCLGEFRQQAQQCPYCRTKL